MINLNLTIPESFYEAEERDGYLVPSEMKKLWAVELDLLNALLNVCQKYDIQIYAEAGTLLGAIRHKGFIPWDDDIDVLVKRSDYIRLCEIAKDEFKHPYFFQTEQSDPFSLRGHAQLRNSNTTCILKSELPLDLPFNQGVFIDIFPLDYVPDDLIERKKFFRKVDCYNKTLRRIKSITTHYRVEKGVKGLVKHLANIVVSPFALKMLDYQYNKCEQLYQTFNNVPTKTIGTLMFYPITVNNFLCAEDFDDYELCQFEMLKIPVPKGYTRILDSCFGNWHEFVVGTAMHGGSVFDCDKDYTSYKKEFVGCATNE